MSEPAGRQTIVATYAHPDDGEFHAAGALAKWAAQGHRVIAICATDGALGSKRRDVSRAQVAATRAEELTAALRELGAEEPVFLGFQDGFLRESYLELRERLIHHFRRLRVDRVVTFDPYKRYEIHPDHLVIGLMASEAAAFSCFPLLHPEHLDAGCQPVQPKEVWYMGPTERPPNRVIDISQTLDKKIAALLRHGSQLEMLADWFVPGANPSALTQDQLSQLRAGAARYIAKMGQDSAQPFGEQVQIAECFYAVRIGPGHFDQHRKSGAGPERANQEIELG